MHLKQIVKASIIAASVAAMLSACNNSTNNQQESVNNESAKAIVENTSAAQASFAYINLDSLSMKYQYCVDATTLLESKLKNYQASATRKQTALQQAQQALQKKLQEGGITSEEQYKKELEKIAKQEQDFVQYCQQQEQSLEMERAQILVTLSDSLNSYLPEYNKAKQYTMILNSAAVLHATKVVDITNEVVAGLNNRYRK